MEAGAAEQSAFIKRLLEEADAAMAQVRGVSPVTSALPRSWEEIAVGHMVLVHESGWLAGSDGAQTCRRPSAFTRPSPRAIIRPPDQA